MRYNAENILQQNEGEKKMAAMTKKEKMAAKSKKIRDKEQRREKLTNWYMINLSFGILAIIAVLILRQLYLMPSMLSYADCDVGNDRCVCGCGNSCLSPGTDREDKE